MLPRPVPAWRCRWCRSDDGAIVLDLGRQPAADHFPKPSDPPDELYPLRMVLCQGCGLAQLEDDPTDADEPRGIEPEALAAQGRAAVADLAAAGLLRAGTKVGEAPSPHGGTWLDAARDAGGVADDDGPVDLLVDSFGMMHEADQRDAWESRAARLADGGVLAVHVHTLATIVRDGTWNALRHGHYAYYSVPVLVAMARGVGLVPVGAWTYGLYGGTVMVAFARHTAGAVPEVEALVAAETAAGVLDPAVVGGLSAAVARSAGALGAWFEENAGCVLAGYGAASRAVALLQLAGAGSNRLLAVADASPTKPGRAMPGSRVPIATPQEIVALRPDSVLLFVPDLLAEVRRAYPEIEASGGRWVIAEPEPYEAAPAAP